MTNPAPDGVVALTAAFTARPGSADTIARLLQRYMMQVRKERGNLVFESFRLSDDPDRFLVYEVYRDEAAFQAHLAAPYGAEFNAELQPLIVEDGSQLTFLRSLG